MKHPLSVYLVNQNVLRLYGEYLLECTVVAASRREALQAAYSLKDDINGFGLTVEKKRLTATRLGPFTRKKPLERYEVRHWYGQVPILTVGTGRDDDG